MKTKRNSRIELLRIISMIMIVLSHYTVHSGIDKSVLPIGFNRLLLELLTLGNLGNFIFICITGYYMSQKNEVNHNLSKILKLFLQILFYSMVIYLLLVVFGLTDFKIKELISCLLPISFNQYWFASAYIILYIFHPYVNRLLNTFTRKEHLNFILIGVSLFYILGTLTTKLIYGSELIQFVLIYSIGAYFNKYKDNLVNRYNKTIFLLSIIILIISVITFDLLGCKIDIFARHSTYLLNQQSFLTLTISISLFSIFANSKSFYNNIINLIASCIFGVYLISDNKYIRKILWINLLKNANYVNSNYLVFHIIISLFLVFSCCIVIEYIRKKIIDRFYDKYISKHINFNFYS